MSTTIMAAVWPLLMPPAAKTVLVSLADQANDDGVCWPSVRSLVERTCLSDRAVRKWLHWLQDRGALRIEARERRNGSLTSNSYAVDAAGFRPESGGAECDAPLHHVQDPPCTTCRTPLHHVQDPPAPRAGPPEPSIEPSVESIPPVVPQGGAGPADGAETGRVRKRAGLITLEQWLAECRGRGERPIPADDPIHPYCRQAGISDAVHWLHWEEFKRRRALAGGKQRGAVGWRQQYRRSVEENWFRLWHMRDGPGGVEAALTSVGVQAQRFHEAQERAASQGETGPDARARADAEAEVVA